MQVANLANISPYLTYDKTVKLLAEAYDNRTDTRKVGIYAYRYTFRRYHTH